MFGAGTEPQKRLRTGKRITAFEGGGSDKVSSHWDRIAHGLRLLRIRTLSVCENKFLVGVFLLPQQLSKTAADTGLQLDTGVFTGLSLPALTVPAPALKLLCIWMMLATCVSIADTYSGRNFSGATAINTLREDGAYYVLDINQILLQDWDETLTFTVSGIGEDITIEYSPICSPADDRRSGRIPGRPL